MNLADLLIVIVLLVFVGSAFVKGFFVEVFSLAGSIVGLFIAAANYGSLSPWVQRVIQNREAANLIAFLFIALFVMLCLGIDVLDRVGLLGYPHGERTLAFLPSKSAVTAVIHPFR